MPFTRVDFSLSWSSLVTSSDSCPQGYCITYRDACQSTVLSHGDWDERWFKSPETRQVRPRDLVLHELDPFDVVLSVRSPFNGEVNEKWLIDKRFPEIRGELVRGAGWRH